MQENNKMQVPDFEKGPALRSIAMPADTNPSGDIFGGWLLSQMDLAGGSVAMRKVKNRVVTIGIEAMNFHLPVFVGDEVSCYTKIVSIGNTSITVYIESWVKRGLSNEKIKVTEGNFTYVSIDANRKPTPIKKVEI